MEQYEEYQDIAPSAFGKFLKLALFRMILFGIIGAFFFGLISVIVWTFAYKDTSVSAAIEYKYDGIAYGQDPFGNKFNPAADITAANVLTPAIAATSGCTELDTQKLKNSISVTGVMPEEIAQQLAALNQAGITTEQIQKILNSLNIFSERYVISVNNYRALGLSDKEALDLLSNVVNQYTAAFEKKYYQPIAQEPLFDGASTEQYEYVEISDLGQTRLDNLLSILETYKTKYPNFISPKTNLTFSAVINDLNTLKGTSLSKYNSFVFMNGIAKDKNYIDEYFNYQIMIYTLEKEKNQTNVNYYEETIKEYVKQPIIVVPDPNNGSNVITIPAPSAAYDGLIRQLNTAKDALTTSEANLKSSQEKQKLFNTEGVISEELLTRADKEVSILVNAINDFIDKANSLIADTYEYQKTENTFQVVASPAATSDSALSFLQILLITFCGLVFGVLLALLVTKIKKNRFERNKTTAAASAPQRLVPAFDIAATVVPEENARQKDVQKTE